MPIIPSTYVPPRFMANGHVQTLYPNFFRRVRSMPVSRYQRERLITSDQDFLDLDWSRVGAAKLAIVSHGLEGDSQRAYIRGMVRALNRAGWDALAWNFRGCSGETNKNARYYHSGESGDLHEVVTYAALQAPYTEIALVGFSLGGNITLKYAGEKKFPLDPRLKKIVAISVPCQLASAAEKMAAKSHRLYMLRFLRQLRGKIENKLHLHPHHTHLKGFRKIKTFFEFDDRYTAPLHGFDGAADYYARSSSRQFLSQISIPTLIINAKNDPFLAPACFPEAEARQNPFLFLEMPSSGGHVGFVTFGSHGEYWSERRTVDFLNNEI